MVNQDKARNMFIIKSALKIQKEKNKTKHKKQKNTQGASSSYSCYLFAI